MFLRLALRPSLVEYFSRKRGTMCIEESNQCGCCGEQAAPAEGDVDALELKLYRELGSVSDIQKCFRLMMNIISDYRDYRLVGRPVDIQKCFQLTERVVDELKSYKNLGCVEYLQLLVKQDMCRKFPFLKQSCSQACPGCNPRLEG